MRALTRVHTGPHLYGPGGVGYVALDVTQFYPTYLRPDAQIRVVDLPGFVEDCTTLSNCQVTYESHHFWLHFIGRAEVLVVVHHGGGWEVWRGDSMLADAMSRYGEDERGLFKLCWAVWDITKAAEEAGAEKASQRYRKAFVDGRLKKRKMPGRDAVKVWIEPEATPALRAA